MSNTQTYTVDADAMTPPIQTPTADRFYREADDTPNLEWFYEGPLPDLFGALAKAQREIQGAEKSATNPYYSSKYADLATVWNAVREPLTSKGLCIIQMPLCVPGKVQLVTVLAHESGGMMYSTLTMPLGDAKPQTIGSLITYMRRYALMAVTGIAPEDDDGNAAQDAAKAKTPIDAAESGEVAKKLFDEIQGFTDSEELRHWAGLQVTLVDTLIPRDKTAITQALKAKIHDLKTEKKEPDNEQ